MVSNVVPETLQAEVGTTADQDIRSPLTIEYRSETERLRQEAYESVNPIYTTKTRYAENQIERINDIFNTVQTVRREAREREREIAEFEEETAESEEENENGNNAEIQEEPPEEITTEEQVERIRTIFPAAQ